MKRPTELINSLDDAANLENISTDSVETLLEWIDCLEELIELELQQNIGELNL